MTLSSTTVKDTFNGDGSTTDFATTFKFWLTSDPKVILVSSSGGETTYTEGSEYTVSGGLGATGTISISSSVVPATNETLVIKSNVPLTQETDLTPGGAFATEDVEAEVDRTVRRVQQMQEQFDRAALLSEGSTYSGITLPDPTASKVLAWNSDGDDLENITPNSSAFLSSPVAISEGGTNATTAGGARTSLGLVIGTDVQAHDSDLDAIAALTHADGSFIVSDGSSWVVEASSVALESITSSSSDGDFLVHNGTNWVSENGVTARTSMGYQCHDITHTSDTALATQAAGGTQIGSTLSGLTIPTSGIIRVTIIAGEIDETEGSGQAAMGFALDVGGTKVWSTTEDSDNNTVLYMPFALANTSITGLDWNTGQLPTGGFQNSNLAIMIFDITAAGWSSGSQDVKLFVADNVDGQAGEITITGTTTTFRVAVEIIQYT